MTVTEVANRLGIGRAAVYRLVGPLTGHGMLRRDGDGRLRLGAGSCTWPGGPSRCSPTERYPHCGSSPNRPVRPLT
ncbi:hypothetical protein GCM10027614_53780 [Micromonospora vulcania]